VTVPIVADARLALQAFLDEFPPDREAFAELHGHASDWMEHIREMQAKHQPKQQYLNRADTENMSLPPHDVYAALTKALNSRGNYRVVTDGRAASDVGGATDRLVPSAHPYHLRRRQEPWVFAVPAALGVAIAHRMIRSG
jgi:acetolactate synthase-1/2/3 large subunit